MRKKPLVMLVDDGPISDVKMALAKEAQERTNEFARLCNMGHVRVLEDENPAFIRCEIEDEVFKEERSRFPSTVLMAKLQLAIAVGRSCRNDPTGPIGPAGAPGHTHQHDAFQSAITGRWQKRGLPDIIFDDPVYTGDRLEHTPRAPKPKRLRRFTAAVKGLRP